MPEASALDDALERRVGEIGAAVFDRVSTAGSRPWQMRWWDERIMDWSMRDPALKVQMFRFVDVLPALPTSRDVAEHIQSHFARGEGLEKLGAKVPFPLRWGAKLARPGTMFGNLAAWIARGNAERMAKRFIAGYDAPEVLRNVAKLRREGVGFTLDLLGEATVTEPEADAYRDEYLRLLDGLGPAAQQWAPNPLLDTVEGQALPRVNVSVKLTALNSQFDPVDPEGSFRVAAGRLRDILRHARRCGAFVNLDMEHYAVKDLTLEIFQRLLAEPEFRDWPDVGIAMQAYMPETEGDLVRLRNWAERRGAPVWVRLVKGAYWDAETVLARQKHWPVPLFTQKWQSDACFERCAAYLLENRRWVRPAFASHNVRSLSFALAYAERLGVPKDGYEIQMLYGMADPLKAAFQERGERLRIYTPFGKLLPGMAYLVRRLLENTSNSSFLRATFVEKASRAALLRAPADAGHAPSAQLAEESTMSARETLPAFVNEPLSDFSKLANRERMAAGLKLVRGQLGREYPLWIGGQEIRGGAWLESRNPANPSELLGKVASANADQARAAVAAAAAAFPAWRATTPLRRADVLLELARKLRVRRWELAAWMCLEVGKQWREADADVAEAIDFCEYYARGMLDLAVPRRRDLPGEDNRTFYAGRGVTVAIAPWNFPLAILCGMAAAPLVAGCTVVMKPAEQSSIVGAKLMELFRELDLPPGTVNFLPGVGEEVGPILCESPDVANIVFTGSVAVGNAINRAAAPIGLGQRHFKRVMAEMGGKNAVIVDDDADLDEAVRGVLDGAFGYQGQKCSACSRAIVLPRVHDAFVARLKDAVASLAVGPPEDPSFYLGPVIDADAKARLLAAAAAAKKSAKMLVGCPDFKLPAAGHYVAPHLFVEADPASDLGQTEFFGPILAVFRAKDLDDALRIANGTRFALTGGCYSRNPATLERVEREFLVGNLYLNRKVTGALVDVQPFGGFNLSGIHAKAGGPDYLKQFLVPRCVTENTLRRGFTPEE